MTARDMLDPPAYYARDPDAVAAIACREGIDLVVLFGSAVRGRLKAGSDVDIAVRLALKQAGPR